MPDTCITPEQARLIALKAQNLLTPPVHHAVKTDVLDAIREMGALQIDTINVVARSPYLSLWSRLGDYDPAWLDELLAEGIIFEYWAHAASFLSMDDFPYFRRICLDGLRFHRYREWYSTHREDCDRVLEHVRHNGSVKSADFERKDGIKGTWWDWKIEKDALEYWFAMGELMISRRVHFQRVYDLRQRVHPEWDDSSAPPLEETIRVLTLKTITALGITLPRWVADYYRLPKNLVQQAVAELQQEQKVDQVTVEGWTEPALVASDRINDLQDAVSGKLQPTLTTLLSPFDALIWDRARTSIMFNFDFTIECYLPAARRNYGYYLLPILYRGNLVGRVDVKAHRREGVFEIKSLFLEPSAPCGQELARDLASAVQNCANWHKTPKVLIGNTVPADFFNLLAHYF